VVRSVKDFVEVPTPQVVIKVFTSQIGPSNPGASSSYIGPWIDFVISSLLSLSKKERNTLQHFIGKNDIVLGSYGIIVMDMIDRLLDLLFYVDQLSDQIFALHLAFIGQLLLNVSILSSIPCYMYLDLIFD
jgi:hypothetical protein